MALKTHDFQQASQWANQKFGEPNFLTYWFPRSQFLEAEGGDGWLSATRRDSGAIYGMAVGANSEINPDWTHFSISRYANQAQIDSALFKKDGEWDAFFIKTEPFSHIPPLENMKDSLEVVEKFLEKNFPDASTRTDSEEVISWSALRNDEGKLVALGALSIWESGGLAAQSITVDKEERGKGYGRAIVEGMISTGFHLGFNSLCLGVWFYNSVAKSLYESIGFTRVDSFIHYSLIDDTQRHRNRPARSAE